MLCSGKDREKEEDVHEERASLFQDEKQQLGAEQEHYNNESKLEKKEKWERKALDKQREFPESRENKTWTRIKKPSLKKTKEKSNTPAEVQQYNPVNAIKQEQVQAFVHASEKDHLVLFLSSWNQPNHQSKERIYQRKEGKVLVEQFAVEAVVVEEEQDFVLPTKSKEHEAAFWEGNKEAQSICQNSERL